MIGLDAVIETQRLSFVANLFKGTTYAAYHRAFANVRDGQTVPEIQTASTNRYKEVLLNSKIAGLSFFMVRPDIEVLGGGLFKADVDIYWAVNLDTLYASVTERAVEYLHRDISEELKHGRFELTGLITGLDAFSEFGFVKIQDNMEPRYLAKFMTTVEYQYNECY